MATTNMRIVIRRDSSSNWASNGDVVLLLGEQGYETDTKKLKIGDGERMYKDLPYFVSGITGYDTVSITADAAGVLSLNSEEVVGDIGTGTIKDYIDAADSVLGVSLAEERDQRIIGDTALGERIDALTEASELADSLIGDRLDEIEATDDGAADSIAVLDSQVGVNHTEIAYLREIAIKHEDSIVALDSKLDTTNQEVLNNYTELKALDAAQQVQIDALAADSVTASELQDSVTALENELAAKADLDSVTSVLLDLDSYVGNYQGGATISDDLVSLAEYNTIQDTVVGDILAGNRPFTSSVTAPAFNGDLRGNVTNGLGDVMVNTTTSAVTAVSVATSAQISAGSILQVGEGAKVGLNFVVGGDSVKASPDNVSGNTITRSNLEVGHRISARSAQLNDNPAGPTDGTLIPFMATADADVTTKKYVDDADAGLIAKLNAIGNDGTIVDVAGLKTALANLTLT